MKGATQCAKRVKQVFKALRGKLGKINPPQTGDPVTQMLLGILTRDAQESKAREALDALRGMVVDYNELRVIPHSEISDIIGDYPNGRSKCEDISRALNRIFAIEHNITLDHLTKMSKTDAVKYLEAIPGLDAYSRARVRLLGLGHHAIPLDEAMWHYALTEEMVDSKCELQDAQAFLERQVGQDEAIEFVTLLRKDAWAEYGNVVRKGAVQKIRSIPPDRTTRNMLQMVAQGGLVEPPEDELLDPELAEPGEEEPVLVGADQADGSEGKAGKGKKAGKSAKKSAAKPESKPAPKAAAPKAKSKPAKK